MVRMVLDGFENRLLAFLFKRGWFINDIAYDVLEKCLYN